MSEDPHALKLYIDGNAYNNPGGNGGYACVAEYPDHMERESELVFECGFHETTNNRTELCACIHAFQYIAQKGRELGVERVQIITDSMYVFENRNRAASWRANKWKNAQGKPIENPDLWKKFLAVRFMVTIRVDVLQRKGKKTPILKMVDKAAKDAGKAPTKHDRGFRTGKIGTSKLRGGSSRPFPACGQVQAIRVYRSSMIRKTGHKAYFDVFDESTNKFTEKCTAHTTLELIADLHRGHCYRVQFNNNPKHPQIIEIVNSVPNFD